MASVNLSGVLLNPEGFPDVGAIVKFTLLTTTGDTVSSSVSELIVPPDGAYSVDIVYGNLRVDYISDFKERFVAIVTVNQDTTATSLPELLNAAVPPTNAQLLQFQTILADTVTAKNAAELAETGAVAAKNIAIASSIIQYQTFAELQAHSETVDYTQYTVAERANAPYTLQPSGYVALAGDATLSNGRVAKLQIDGISHLSWFGAAQDAETLLDAATDDLAACNLAALRMQQEGGGTILMSGLAALSGTLEIPQRVFFEGTSLFFANQFTNNKVRPAGCGFYALSGLNDDVIDLKLDIYNDGGTLRETVNNKELNDYRYFGGLKNLIVYGNRSDTANPPATVDKNTTGNGINVSGVRYPIVRNVITMMCAEHGVATVSYDYGLGANSCNNTEFENITSLSNAKNGGSLSGGDSKVVNFIAGYNGINGVGSTMGASELTGKCWNNQQDGLAISGGDRSIYNFNCYDQKRSGFRISGTKSVRVTGVANANGRDSLLSSTVRVGCFIVDDNEGLVFDITSDGDKDLTNYQRYGFNIYNTTNVVYTGSSVAINNSAADWLVAVPANLIKGGNAP